jgi:hypothetical protein
MSPRLVLAGSLAGAALVAAVAAPAAIADPKCTGTTAGAVHEAEEAASSVPVVGSTVAGVLHGPVEDAACKLP